MNKVHYYSGWLDGALPKQLAESLRNDITNRKSIAVVWGAWAIDKYVGYAKKWFNGAGIIFGEYHGIDNRMDKATAHDILRNASVIVLMGDDTIPQRDFMTEYELAAPIKENNDAIIMGTSAGAKNMAEKFVCAIDSNHEAEERAVYDGLALDSFSYEPYFSLGKTGLIQNYLLPLSQEIDIYATGKDTAIRAENGEVKVVVGDVYLITGSNIQKIEDNSE